MHEYRHYNISFTVDFTQAPITRYYEECTQQELVIHRLLEENNVFRDLLIKQKVLEKFKRPHFLQEILDAHTNQSMKRKVHYEESFKESCLALRIMMGQAAYKIFRANVTTPGLTTLHKTLHKHYGAKEGELVVEETARRIKANDEQLYAWIAEDDTKIQDGVSYDPTDDQVIGLCLPLDESGMPRKLFFEFVSISAVRDYLKTYPMSTYMKLVTLTTLSPNARTYTILLYGTKGTDTYGAIRARWRYIFEAFKAVGITIVGFSSDGFPAYLKTMKSFVILPCATPDCPVIFTGFFRCSWTNDFYCIQDPTHVVVKFHRALATKEPVIAKKVASRAILFSTVGHLGKGVTVVTLKELEGQRDMMSFSICERAASTAITDRMVRPEERATALYLRLIQLTITAFLDPSTLPLARLSAAFEVVFFLRMWKISLSIHSERRKSTDSEEDTHHISIEHNFISSNLNECCEMNAHNLLMFMCYCRDISMPWLFLPTRTGSQPCEATFRTLRSMATMKQTAINVSMRDVISLIKRLSFLCKHRTTAAEDGTFNYPTAREKPLFIPETLPTNEEAKEAVDEGFRNAKESMRELGFEWRLSAYPEPNLTAAPFCGLPEPNDSDDLGEIDPDDSLNFTPTLSEEKKSKKPSKTAPKGKAKKKHTSKKSSECVEAENSADLDVIDIPDEVIHDDLFLSNLEYLISRKEKGALEVFTVESEAGTSAAIPVDIDSLAEKIPKQYLVVMRGGEQYLIKKCTLLWLLSTNTQKVPTDRLRRFIGEKRTANGKRLCCGDFVIMVDKKEQEVVCQVIGFAFKKDVKKKSAKQGAKETKKPKRFIGNSCPYEGEVARTVRVLVQCYSLVGREIKTETADPSYIDMIKYKRKISLKRNIETGAMELRMP